MNLRSWEMLRALNIATAIVCAAIGYLAGPSWFGMLDAMLVGYNLGAALWITRPIIPMVRAVEQMHIAFKEMTDINDALIHNRVVFHLQGILPPQNSSDESKPKLH